jgi:hypothetical protein
MKTTYCKATLTTAVLSVVLTVIATAAGNPADEAEFPYFIQADLGATEFAPGDNIVITSFRGDRQHIEVGGHYLLEGSYTLGSAESADLAWFSTSRGPSGSTPVADAQHVNITAGSGDFRLKKTMTDDGWLHISFYVDKHSHGGVYFGEKGFENTVFRQKGWSDFSRNLREGLSPVEAASKPPAVQIGGGIASGQANAAIMAYLGDPVPAPANLDSKYWPTNLAAAFIAMGNKSGWHIQKLVVDESEFPFLVYGLIDGRHALVEKDIREMEGYDYSGSVRDSTDKRTYFSLNMIPHSQYPAGQAAACNRRLMVRLQMLAETVRQAD